MKRYLSSNLLLWPPASDLHPAVWKYLSSVRKQSWQLSDNRLLLLMRSSPLGPALVVGEVGDCEVWCHHRCQPRPICQIFLLNFNFTPATCLCRPDPPQHKHCRAHQLTLVTYCILQIAFCLFLLERQTTNIHLHGKRCGLITRNINARKALKCPQLKVLRYLVRRPSLLGTPPSPCLLSLFVFKVSWR